MFREFAGLLKRASAAAGVASLVAFAGQANAVSYVGSWDPAFGDDFQDLGWRGEAVFEIPKACLDLGAGIYTNLSPCASANGGLRITSAVVEFYQVGSEPTSIVGEGVIGAGGVLDILEFQEPSFTITMEVDENRELSGVIGFFLTTDSSNISLVTSEGYQGAGATFALGFIESPFGSGDYYAQMGWSQKRKWWEHCPLCSAGFSDLIQDPERGSFLTFRQVGLEVPEPGSLALLLPAVGMLAAFRRRRSASAA